MIRAGTIQPLLLYVVDLYPHTSTAYKTKTPKQGTAATLLRGFGLARPHVFTLRQVGHWMLQPCAGLS